MSMVAALLLAGSDPIAAFYAELTAANSATAVLQRRCEAPITADVDKSTVKEATADIRKALGADADTVIAYRSVRLKCGDVIFSRADNWYRPDRLTPEMNALLSGDKPFGAVIATLKPIRQTIEIERVDSSDTILRHRALVVAANGLALAEVVENYTAAVLVEPINP